LDNFVLGNRPLLCIKKIQIKNKLTTESTILADRYYLAYTSLNQPRNSKLRFSCFFFFRPCWDQVTDKPGITFRWQCPANSV